MACITEQLFESVGGRGGEERSDRMRSVRMRNKEKHNEIERESVREIYSPSEGHMSHAIMVIFAAYIIEIKLFFLNNDLGIHISC